MSGRVLVSILLAIAAVAGAGLWYTTQYLYYETVTDVDTVTVAGDARPVRDYQGIDADSSPLKLRACFRVDWDYAAAREGYSSAEPLTAPSWFNCFDARTIAQDLAAGRARVLTAEENDPYGFTTYIAQYPDGRAFLWRQINACGAAAFDGEDVPEGCPDPARGAALAGTQVASAAGVAAVAVQSDAPAPEAVTLTMVPATGGPPEPILADDVTLRAAPFAACFTTPHSIPMLTETYFVAENPVPAPAPDLPCYNAAAIRDALNAGTALAFLAIADVAPGTDRIIAVFDGGRARAWHQPRN